MKHLYELPTDNIILKCLANDVIGRNKDVANFCYIIDSFQDSTIISLDGAWGSGKTFFVKQTKLLIDGLCNPEILDPEILAGFTRAVEANRDVYPSKIFDQKHATVYYDAWENDDDTDPILSIVNAVLKSKQVPLQVKNDRNFVDILSSIAECVTGRSINALSDAIMGDDFFEDIKKHESINELMRRFLDAALGTQNNRLVVFIDELDRCKPTFAVLLLERIKHFFTDNRLTFVFSINKDQLQHTIKTFYGNAMDACKYLDKFFDLYICIPQANTTKFLAKIGLEHTNYTYDYVRFSVINQMHLELRVIAKYIQQLRITIDDEANKKSKPRYAYDSSMEFCMIFIVPIIVGLQISDHNRYQLFISGKDGTPLFEILSSPELMYATQSFLLKKSETYMQTGNTNSRNSVKYEERLQEVYNAIFNEKPSGSSDTEVGETIFRKDTKLKIMKLVSPLSSPALHKKA